MSYNETYMDNMAAVQEHWYAHPDVVVVAASSHSRANVTQSARRALLGELYLF